MRLNNIFLSIALWFLDYVYNHLDDNKDGVIDKEELNNHINQIKNLFNKK